MNPNDLSSFGLTPQDIEEFPNQLTIIKKWNWDYEQAWKFQKYAQELIEDGRKIVIFTSHPNVLTNGRGLQKPKKDQTLKLQEFKFTENLNLPYPLFQIERGGGLTFHHPGQFIVYPIIKLHPQKLGLSQLVDDLLNFTQHILEKHGLNNLTSERALLGLWHGDQKLASVGIAAHKMKTMHGMALNLHAFNDVKKMLTPFSPCGLNMNTYTSVEDLGFKISHNEMYHEFKQKVLHAW